MDYESIYNRFSDIVKKYITEPLNKRLEKDSNVLFDEYSLDADCVLSALPDIKIKDQCCLRVCRLRENYFRPGEFYSNLYVCRKDTKGECRPSLTPVRDTLLKKLHLQKCGQKYMPAYNESMVINEIIDNKAYQQMPPIWDSISVPFTEEGIWQALLLKEASMFLPMFGHGNYHSGYFCFENEEMDFILGEGSKKLVNYVHMADGRAEVACTYYNYSKGSMVTKKYIVQKHSSIHSALLWISDGVTVHDKNAREIKY